MTELIAATELAHQAGAAILQVKQSGALQTKEKYDGSGPVTVADTAADALIREGLSKRFPDDPIVSEETFASGSRVSRADRVWFVDPLDGTNDFVAGRNDYAVQIGLVVKGQPALGVIYQPESRMTWRGLFSGSDQLAERLEPDGRIARLHCDRSPLLTHAPRIAVSMSHPHPFTDELVRSLNGVPRKKGSVGLKVALIVDGEVDAYFSPSGKIKMWDTAAPAALLHAAGGRVTSLLGTPLLYVGDVHHSHGVRAWTHAAEASLSARVEETLVRYRRPRPGF